MNILHHVRLILVFLIIFLGISCSNDTSTTPSSSFSGPLFNRVKDSGVDFVNKLTPTVRLSTFNYQYFQNGGGVAVADFNNDELPDLFFTSNQESDKLYINKGNLKFEDITEKAGVAGWGHKIIDSWSTGATVADVNKDGYMDIYVCKSGPYKNGQGTENLLYINNRDLTFTERSKEYGLNNNGHSTQAVFFDYDKDLDLDLYVLNHSDLFGNLEAAYEKAKDINFSRKHSGVLYRNDGKKFTDVSMEAGIVKFGYGLGLVASDLNQDGWTDLYVANDFSRPDFLFINQGDGTFKDEMKESTGHTSYYSMGCDAADINNDGLLDISVVDMAPASNFHSKTLMPSMQPEVFNALVNDFGYAHQYMFNALQLSHGEGKFSEIAKLVGVHKTDWSWATLLADFDNDGLKDMFVSNGYRYNKMENDFSISFKAMKTKYNGNIPDDKKEEWINRPPSYKLKNKIFRNDGSLHFEKKSEAWGLTEETYSNGAAYADLDQDGDLDLIINNIDEPAFIYENRASEKGNYLQIKLLAGKRDQTALTLNAKVKVYTGDQTQYQEYTLTRGFQSAVEGILHFGLGKATKVDKIEVVWSDGLKQELNNIDANQKIKIDKSGAGGKAEATSKKASLFTTVTNSGIDFKHQENQFNDFEKEILLPHKNSQHGPFISKADVNGDGKEDFFIGGAKGQSGALYIQKSGGTFTQSKSNPWRTNANSEDMQSVFFDADKDGDLDMYVVSGGNEYSENDAALQDRLYKNDGKGNFIDNTNSLPALKGSGSTVVNADFNGDGWDDLFVGGRMVPGKYPYASNSYILINNKGVLEDKTDAYEAELKDIGIVTDAIIEDVDKDGKPDLMIVGEWAPIKIFKNTGENLIDITPDNLMKETGWWNRIEKGDFDKDGDMDFIVGNLGLNYKYKATQKEPFQIYANDFDKTGSLDIVLGYFNDGVCYPLRGRECSSQQMPFITEKFPTYKDFASASITDVYGKDLDKSYHKQATNFANSILINEGNGQFSLKALPINSQVSCINTAIIADFDKDGNIDLLTAGNLFAAEVETPRNDASIGQLLKGNSTGEFKAVSVAESGFYAPGDVKDMTMIETDAGPIILVANNNSSVKVFRLEQ